MDTSVNKKVKKKPAKRIIPKRSSHQKRIFWGCFSLFLIISLVVIGRLLTFLNSASPAFSNSTDRKDYSYNGESTINLVFKTDAIYSLFYDPNDKSATILKVPDETYLDLAFGFGRYPARSIYDLGQAEKLPMGAKLLKHTISNLEGEVMDAVVLSKDPRDFRPPAKIVEELRQNPLAVFQLALRVDSDLSKIELLRLFWNLGGIRADNLKVFDLGNSSLTRSLLLADGSRGLTVDQSRLDLLIQAKFKDSRLMDEGLSIGVINSTSHPRLAESVARVISNMGGRVIYMTNSKTNYNQSYVVGARSYTATRLGQLFAPRCLENKSFFLKWFKKPKCVINDPEIVNSRAQVNVVLGEDFYNNTNVR